MKSDNITEIKCQNMAYKKRIAELEKGLKWATDCLYFNDDDEMSCAAKYLKYYRNLLKEQVK